MNSEKRREYNQAYRLAHLDEISVRRRAWYVAHREEQRAKDRVRNAKRLVYRKAYDKAYYARNRERLLEQDRMIAFGIDAETFERKLNRQQGRCAICQIGLVRNNHGRHLNAPCVDHDHESGLIRMILCGRCNRALGGFKDSPEILRAALAYLTLAKDSMALEPG